MGRVVTGNNNTKSIPLLFFKDYPISDETSWFLFFLQWLFPSWRSGFYNGKIALTSTVNTWGGWAVGRRLIWVQFSKSMLWNITVWIIFSIFVCYDEHILSGKHSHRSELNEAPRLPLLNAEKGYLLSYVFHHCELYGSKKWDDLYSENV